MTAHDPPEKLGRRRSSVNTELTARHVTPNKSGSEEVPLCRGIARTIAFWCLSFIP